MGLFLVVLTMFSVNVFAADPMCIDISGEYSAPWDDQDNETTFMYSQTDCNYVIISGYSIDYVTPSSTQFSAITFYLDGRPPSGFAYGPCWGAAPGVCATYKARPTFIEKTLDKTEIGVVGDPIHGACYYSISHLSKDANGNLLEEPQVDKCDDGYTGKINPKVFLKKK